MKTNLKWMIFSLIMIELVAVLFIFHFLTDNYIPLGIVKFSVIISIFTCSLFLPKLTCEHRLIGYAITFLLIGDIFFIFTGLLPGVTPETLFVKIGGMSGFFIAYIILCFLFIRNFSFGYKDLIALIPILLIIIPVAIFNLPYLHGPLLIGTLIFAFIVSFMAWNGLCTLHRGYFKRRVAIKLALAGFLMFASDMGVTFGLFYPEITRQDPWLGNFIWITYIPGWTLLLLNLFETNLKKEE